MGKKVFQLDIFGESKEVGQAKSREEVFADYESFVDKFKGKKTTDDCYTPPEVYEAIKEWVNDNILSLEGVPIVRPFKPGGDYIHEEYPEGCIVLDNPPFSILAQIRRFYHSQGIRYFLFAPSLTLANSAKELEDAFIITEADIVYENGATIPTSFITNIDCGGIAIWGAGDLTKKIERVQKKENRKPSYQYPINVCSPALLGKIVKRGIIFKFHRNSVFRITKMDCQQGTDKSIYGGGWLLSERAAAERAAAERAAAERAAAERAIERECIEWELSEREKEIIKKLK